MGSNFDTTLEVFTGTAINALTLVASDDQAGGANTSLAIFPVVSGTTYHFRVMGWASAAGSIVFNIEEPPPPPANDAFADRITISGNPVFVDGTTVSASVEANEPVGAINSVWFSWTAPATGALSISCADPTFSMNPQVNAYTGTTLAGLSQELSISGWWNFPQTLNANAGVTYQIRVHGAFPPNGPFRLGITQGAPNDLFANAINLGSTPSGTSPSFIDSGTATESGEPDGFTAGPFPNPNNSIWWQWTAPSADLVSFDTFGSTLDTVLEVFTGSSVNSLTSVAKSEDANTDGHSRVSFVPTPGTTYRIRVMDENPLEGSPPLAIGTVALNHQTFSSPVTTADYIRLGRARLELQTDADLAAADSAFDMALTLTPGHPEASFLKAMTGLAMLEQGTAFQTALAGVGLLDSSLYAGAYDFPRDGMGKRVPVPGSDTQPGIDYLVNTLLPALGVMRGHLANASDPGFSTTLTDRESSIHFLQVDHGDVRGIKATLSLLEAVIRLLQTFDAGASVADAVQDYNSGNLTAENVIDSFVNFLDNTAGNQRSAFKTALQSANTDYQAGSDFIRNTRTNSADESHLFYLPPGDEALETEARQHAQNVSDALNGPGTVAGETVDISNFVVSNRSLRGQLPALLGDKAVSGTTPDPTFDGVVPNGTQPRVDAFLRKQGLLHEVSQFGGWAAHYLKNLAPQDQLKTANPDLDLLNNFAEYAFNLDPTTPNGSQSFQVSNLQTHSGDGKKYLHLTFVRRIVRTDLSYVVAVSDNLSAWDRTQTQVQQVGSPTPNADGITETVTFRVLADPAITDRKFVRIEVTDIAP